MKQIDMDKVKKDTINSAEIKKSSDVDHIEAGKQSVESIDNTSEEPKDINETKKEPTTEAEDKATGKVVVTYVGGGVWKDSEGKLWASQDKAASIKSERQYTAEEYEKRNDIKFMVQYGSVKVTYVK